MHVSRIEAAMLKIMRLLFTSLRYVVLLSHFDVIILFKTDSGWQQQHLSTLLKVAAEL